MLSSLLLTVTLFAVLAAGFWPIDAIPDGASGGVLTASANLGPSHLLTLALAIGLVAALVGCALPVG